MDNFMEVYRLQAVAAILKGLGNAESSLNDVKNLNQGLNILGDIVSECADIIEKRDNENN